MEILEVMGKCCTFEKLLCGGRNKESRKNHRKAAGGKTGVGIYLLTLSGNKNNLMEILPASMLMQKSFFELCPDILGMAKGKENAIEMAAELLEDMYRRTGSFAVEEYMKNR